MQRVADVGEKAYSKQHVACSCLTRFLRLRCTHSMRKCDGGENVLHA